MPRVPPSPRHAALLAALALTANAFVWGTSWWPLRWLEARGLHPLWATAIVYSIAVATIVAARPRAVRQLATTPALWLLLLAAGSTNAAFNWGVVIGDVVRVVLLFYLMPLWAVLLARWLLHEPLTRGALLRVSLALAGAAIVLWPAERSGWDALPLPASLPDWLGLIGGFTFALNNVLLRRESHRPEEGRALAMFVGGASVSALLAAALASSGHAAWPPAPQWGWLAGAALLSLVFLGGNLALQYGASRLPANVTAVVMLTEVLFASSTALLAGAGTLSTPLVVGGALIVAAAALAAGGGVAPDAARPQPAKAGGAANAGST